MSESDGKDSLDRRRFVKRCLIGCGGLALGAYTLNDLFIRGGHAGIRAGFPGDAPEHLWQWSREADWYVRKGPSGRSQIHCTLCPHQCILDERSRGLCRTRVVFEGKLHTVAYGNPCAVHLDPVEKKPLYHFLPSSWVFSLATGGCNLRCLNCQNWEISQSTPEQTRAHIRHLPPEKLVETVIAEGVGSIAYTYSEPIVFYEYVYDSAVLARKQGIKNVLVTAGYIREEPLRKLARVIDAANVDIKSFSEDFYTKVCKATLAPVLRAIEIMREEGVWVEITRLIVPSLSDETDDIRRMCRWIASSLGPDTPLHLSRFHPAYRLMWLPPTPLEIMDQAMVIARDEGLRFVYVGNVMERKAQDTVCPQCGETVIARRGYQILFNHIRNGRCPCGTLVPGIWS